MMPEEYHAILDSVYAKCSQWHSLPTEADIEEYMTETLYSFGDVRPYDSS